MGWGVCLPHRVLLHFSSRFGHRNLGFCVYTTHSHHCGRLFILTFCTSRCSQLTLCISCPSLESAISPQSPGSFCWRTVLETKIWVLSVMNFQVWGRDMWCESVQLAFVNHVKDTVPDNIVLSNHRLSALFSVPLFRMQHLALAWRVWTLLSHFDPEKQPGLPARVQSFR